MISTQDDQRLPFGQSPTDQSKSIAYAANNNLTAPDARIQSGAGPGGSLTKDLLDKNNFDDLDEEKSPMYMAIYNMLAGCGIVGLPLQTKQSGIIPGIILMAIVAVFSTYTLRLLIKNGRRVNVMNYEDLCKKCWGMFGYYNLIASILLFDIGQCLTYSIILGNSASHVFGRLCGDSFSLCHDRRPIIIASYIFFIFPFSMGKDFRFIEKISAFAIFSIVIMIGIVTFEYWHHYRSYDEQVDLVASSVTDIVQAFGAIAFAFSQQDQTFLVYKTLYNPTTNRFTFLAACAMGIQFVLCTCVGVFGYMSFGDDVDDDILKNYPKDNTLILVIRVIYVFTMVFIFPTAFYVVRHILYSAVFYKQEETYEKASFKWRLIFTTVPLAFFCGLSLVVDNLGMVMTLTGLVAVVNLTFILPCWVHLHLTEYPILFWRAKPGQKCAAIIDTWPSVALLVFGIFACVIGIVGLFLPS